MFMFYEINKDYYVLVGRKYIKVDFKVEGDEINAIPTKEFIEKDNNVKAIPKSFNDEFKKEIINMKKGKSDDFKEENIDKNHDKSLSGRSRFGR